MDQHEERSDLVPSAPTTAATSRNYQALNNIAASVATGAGAPRNDSLGPEKELPASYQSASPLGSSPPLVQQAHVHAHGRDRDRPSASSSPRHSHSSAGSKSKSRSASRRERSSGSRIIRQSKDGEGGGGSSSSKRSSGRKSKSKRDRGSSSLVHKSSSDLPYDNTGDQRVAPVQAAESFAKTSAVSASIKRSLSSLSLLVTDPSDDENHKSSNIRGDDMQTAHQKAELYGMVGGPTGMIGAFGERRGCKRMLTAVTVAFILLSLMLQGARDLEEDQKKSTNSSDSGGNGGLKGSHAGGSSGARGGKGIASDKKPEVFIFMWEGKALQLPFSNVTKEMKLLFEAGTPVPASVPGKGLLDCNV